MFIQELLLSSELIKLAKHTEETELQLLVPFVLLEMLHPHVKIGFPIHLGEHLREHLELNLPCNLHFHLILSDFHFSQLLCSFNKSSDGSFHYLALSEQQTLHS